MRLDHARRVPFLWREISFSQGGEWKALISTYVGIMPLSGEVCSAAEQSTSSGPPLCNDNCDVRLATIRLSGFGVMACRHGDRPTTISGDDYARAAALAPVARAERRR